MPALERQLEQLTRRLAELEREVARLREPTAGVRRPYSELSLAFATDEYSGANATSQTSYLVELNGSTPFVIDNTGGTAPLSVSAKVPPTGVFMLARMRDGTWVKIPLGSFYFDVRYQANKFEKTTDGTNWTTVFTTGACGS